MKIASKNSLYLSLASLFLLFGCSVSDAPASPNSVAYYAHLSLANENHKLYPVGSKDAPHPFYKTSPDSMEEPYQDACGIGAFLFDPDKNELRFSIAYSGLSGSPVMMHIHLGGPKDDGPIIQTIFGEPYADVKGLGYSTHPPLYGKKGPKGRAGFVSGIYKLAGNDRLKTQLTPEDEKQKLLDGELYVNIHTYLNQAGEIRGQILPCTE